MAATLAHAILVELLTTVVDQQAHQVQEAALTQVQVLAQEAMTADQTQVLDQEAMTAEAVQALTLEAAINKTRIKIYKIH